MTIGVPQTIVSTADTSDKCAGTKCICYYFPLGHINKADWERDNRVSLTTDVCVKLGRHQRARSCHTTTCLFHWARGT